jgi:hypothetical protein
VPNGRGDGLPWSHLAGDAGTTHRGNGGAADILRGGGAFRVLGAVAATPPGKGCGSRGLVVSRLGGGGGLRRILRCRDFQARMCVKGCVIALRRRGGAALVVVVVAGAVVVGVRVAAVLQTDDPDLRGST